MARQSVMIPIESELLKKMVIEKCGTISSLEGPLKVTKQAISAWLANGRIPPKKLDVLADTLDLDETALLKITKRYKQSAVLFRTTRNVPVTRENKEVALGIAKDFFLLDYVPGEQKREVGFSISTSVPSELAEAILERLKLTREQLSLDSLIRSLERNDIHVLFLDFCKHFNIDNSKKVLRAFSVKEGQKYVVVVNSNEPIEDVTWIICHELAHIFSGDLSKEDLIETGIESEELEQFCNKTATQIVTPDSFFVQNRTDLEQAFACKMQVLPYTVDRIANLLGAGFSAVIQALVEHKLISADQKRYLYGVYHNRQKLKAQPNVRDILISEDSDAVEALDRSLSNPDLQKFLKLQVVVRKGLVEERISFRRAAELYGTNEMAVRDLLSRWQKQDQDDSAPEAAH